MEGSPNVRLRALLREANWTGEELARAVNAVGAEAGVKCHHNRSSVAHWLAGRRPRHPNPALIAEALSRRLERTVVEHDAGLASEPPDAVGSVLRLERLYGAALSRDSVAQTFVYSPSVLPLRGWGGQSATVRTEQWQRRSAPPGADAVRSAWHMVRLFAAHLDLMGGGAARPALVGYLTQSVLPWLDEPGTGPALRLDLLKVTGLLAYLAGFACFDDLLHGAAQEFYILAAHCASAVGDPVSYAVALTGLSGQADSLGHRDVARRLAESALDSAARRAPAETKAFLHGHVAVASAADDPTTALGHIDLAERALERPGGAAVIGRYHRAELFHHRAHVLARSGDRVGAIRAFDASVRHRPAGERRARAITMACLARAQLDAGRIDASCATWGHAWKDCGCLDSARVRHSWASLRSAMRPYGRLPAVRALLNRLSGVAPPPPLGA